MKRLTERFLSTMLAIVILVSLCSCTVIVGAMTDGCKIVDILFSEVLTENRPNTMNITVGSLNYSGGFKLEVYEGGKERQKVFEGSGSGSGSGGKGNTWSSLPSGGCKDAGRNIPLYGGSDSTGARTVKPIKSKVHIEHPCGGFAGVLHFLPEERNAYVMSAEQIKNSKAADISGYL